MKKELVIIGVVAAIAVAFFAGRAFDKPAPAPSVPSPKAETPSSKVESTPANAVETAKVVASVKVARHPVMGPADARVTIVEISDFQCPFCARGTETVKALQKAYPGDLRVVFIHLPLPFHDQAVPAAIASMAAHRQGKFWQLHSQLFAASKKLSTAQIELSAKAAGLDMSRFRKDVKDPALREQVADDTAIANSLGIGGTPAYFINGVQISGAQPLSKMKAVVEAQLRRADALLREGVPRSKLHQRSWRRNNPAKADAAIDWIIRGRKPPKSARPKPKPQEKQPAQVKAPAKPVHPAKDKTVWRATLRGSEPSRGPKDAPITLVLYTDFQCPFCSRVRPALAQVEKTYAGKVRLVFKNQPLSFHKLAPLAAEAGLCAHAQGRFWEMEAHLFSHQKELKPAQLLAHGKQLGLDTRQFASCLTKHSQRSTLAADMKSAAELQVSGTPTTFVNGRKISGAQPFSVFARVIDQELAKAAALTKAGTAPAALYDKLIAKGKRVEVRPELGESVFKFDISGSPRLGPAKTKIQIVVFEDLQCPFCARLGPALAAVRRQLGDAVSVVIKHLPLSNQCNAAMGRDMHPAACQAAFWAMAAYDQELFFAFSKQVFANMKTLMPDDGDLPSRLKTLEFNLKAHAKAVKVDLVKAEQYIAEQRFSATIGRDIREAAQLRLRGTPSVFINGREYNGPLSPDRIIAAAKMALADSKRRKQTRRAPPPTTARPGPAPASTPR
ncbi:MAG: thioredoxin domain-containing protein [Myxococcales bacterium]|nr:thioredoxin domain-containing protein [Myxococcales bacterium]